MIRRLLIAVGIVLALGATFLISIIVASETGAEVVTVETEEPDGSVRETRLWIVDEANFAWLRAGMGPVPWLEQATAKGWEGIVAVHFTVLADGRVKDNVYFDQTSVHRDLNQAAMAAIKQFRFAPLPSDQAAIEQWGVITIVFRLN